MLLFDKEKGLFLPSQKPEKQQDTQVLAKGEPSDTAPIEAGRSSVDENQVLGRFNSMYLNVNDFTIQDLDLLEQLAMRNNHVSMAVENIVAMANTNVRVSFSDAYSDKQKRAMALHLEMAQESWYSYSEGEYSLDGDRFAQLSTFGVVSTEAEIKDDLSGIKKVHRVSPKYIRFQWDADIQDYIAVQVAPVTTLGVTGGSFVRRLNPLQYHYMALRRITSMPYGIPPYLAAIHDLAVEHDMRQNFSDLMRRVGLLGFLSVLVNKPKKEEWESTEQYQSRLKTTLQKQIPQVDNMMGKGYAIGYDGSTTFDIKGGSQVNANAGEKLLEMWDKQVFEGLKQDPNFFGHQFSTTETYGKVLIQKFAKQTESYQKLVAKDKDRKASLELMLAGFPILRNEEIQSVDTNPFGLSYVFEKSLTIDKKETAEAEGIEIDNSIKLYNQGIIDNTGVAHRNGVTKPDQDSERYVSKEYQFLPSGEDGNTTNKEEQSNHSIRIKAIGRYLNKFNLNVSEYEYELPKEIAKETFFDGFQNDSELTAIFKDYQGDITKNYLSVYEKAKKGIREDLTRLSESSSASQVEAIVSFHILRFWQSEYIEKNKPIINGYINTTYEKYREDTRPFQLSHDPNMMAFEQIPDAIMDLRDFRAIEYLESLDKLFLGKFITDESTIKKFSDYINEFVLSEGLPPNSPVFIDKFIEEFGELFAFEAWKITRVISTTLNRVRNIANLSYIDQANVKEFEVVEVLDRKTCPWCRHMNGKTFSVSIAISKTGEVIEGTLSDMEKKSPFATSFNIDEFTKLDSTSIQQLGVDLPPYHPHCRGRIVAVI